MIQNPSPELQLVKQELVMVDSHHNAKGMKKKFAHDLMWLAMCIENVERLGQFKIPYPKIS
jgi:hypothetical protein